MIHSFDSKQGFHIVISCLNTIENASFLSLHCLMVACDVGSKCDLKPSCNFVYKILIRRNKILTEEY